MRFLVLLLFLGACSPAPDCEDAAYTSHGLCIIDPPMGEACFGSLFDQIHTALDAKVYPSYVAWSWRPQWLDEEDAATMRDGSTLWTETRPGLSPYRIAEIFVHEIMHVVDFDRNGHFPDDLPMYEMHAEPHGYFKYVYGVDSLEWRILAGLDYACLQ